jgi:hypothetical protein
LVEVEQTVSKPKQVAKSNADRAVETNPKRGKPVQATKPAGKFVQIEGQVTTNGTSAISGATVFSYDHDRRQVDCRCSLGKLGRVEVLPGSTACTKTIESRARQNRTGSFGVSSCNKLEEFCFCAIIF